MAILGIMNDMVYRVVVVKQHRGRVNTILRKLHEAASKAGVVVGAIYETQQEAEDALLAVKKHLAADVVAKVEYGARHRYY